MKGRERQWRKIIYMCKLLLLLNLKFEPNGDVPGLTKSSSLPFLGLEFKFRVPIGIIRFNKHPSQSVSWVMGHGLYREEVSHTTDSH